MISPRRYRFSESDSEHGNKRRKQDHLDFKSYQATDGLVDLPKEFVDMLNSSTFMPEPRSKFEEVLANVKASDYILLPSIGQEPKNFGEGYLKKNIFITEHMIDLWNRIRVTTDYSVKRVLAGPQGVGKSYLSLFLAAKAYAEGHLLFYITDGGVLNQPNIEDVSKEICSRFLALNHDILTAAELQKLFCSILFCSIKEINWTAAASNIMEMFEQRYRKTFFIVGEHGALFHNPLDYRVNALLGWITKITRLGEHFAGTRLILTGTAHAKFEMKLNDDAWYYVEIVEPLSKTVFDKLLQEHTVLKNFKQSVMTITNCVPSELMRLNDYISFTPNDQIPKALKTFVEMRSNEIERGVEAYYQLLSDDAKSFYRRALASMFLPKHVRELFQWEFMDLGFVYRYEDEMRHTHLQPLCPAAEQALLKQYLSIPLPEHTNIMNIFNVNEGFEDRLFFLLMKKPNVIFKTTNLVGVAATSVCFNFEAFHLLKPTESSAGLGSHSILVHGHSNYPQFNFMLGRMFIQVSKSDFASHNDEHADIKRAFKHPMPGNINSDDNRNQLEIYMDEVYGGIHSANIDKNGHFVVSRKDNLHATEQLLFDFHIIYICGSPGNPNHTEKVEEFPDVIHISCEELNRVFGAGAFPLYPLKCAWKPFS